MHRTFEEANGLRVRIIPCRRATKGKTAQYGQAIKTVYSGMDAHSARQDHGRPVGRLVADHAKEPGP